MAAKSCCIDDCNSSSVRQEDTGVTYHKFPKDTTLRDTWVNITRQVFKGEAVEYVCSRHFCKSDFQTYKDSKYILKSDAVPSIFSWTMSDANLTEPQKMEEDTSAEEKYEGNTTKSLNNAKESDSENVDAIRRFIEDQEKEIAELNTETKAPEIVESTESTESINKEPEIVETTESTESINKEPELNDIEVKVKNEAIMTKEKISSVETLEVASSVMEMIMSESEAKINAKREMSQTKQRLSGGEKASGSMPLSVGSKVEAKDFGEFWHPAEIVEVDYDEMEVLVHYEDIMKKHDEWISVSSPRLRPRGIDPPLKPSTSKVEPSKEPSSHIKGPSTPKPNPSVCITPVTIKEEPKEPKSKVSFEVGERCLARWRDNRRFIATVAAELDNGKYEIIFDDGVRWTCSNLRLSKLKDGSNDPLMVDTTGVSSTCSTPSPVYGAGPSNDATGITSQSTPTPQMPLPFNTHLFDPTRDYLGPKSERRAMKRKLNIKEIFNIGQKKKKTETPPRNVPKEKTLKVVREKKPKVTKKIKEENVNEITVKKEIPDAVASIIGTLPKETLSEESIDLKVDVVIPEIKEEIKDEIEVIKVDIDDNLDLANSETLSAPETQDMKHEDDPALYEDVRLEKFDKEDNDKHEEVIDRIKEAIIKLEGGTDKAEKQTEQVDIKPEVKEEEIVVETKEEAQPVASETKKKNLSKIKKVKKVRLLQEKRVKKEVEKVKSELEDMKRQVEEMKKKMAEKLSKPKPIVMPESFLLPGEWCCKWVNGQPVGTVSEMEAEIKTDFNNKPVLPRRSVQVEDKRLPPGWTKHIVRRSFGNSAGKWDVVLISPENRRFHTKTDMKHFFESNSDHSLKRYEHALMDFGIHLKLTRRMGWYTTTPDGEQEAPSLLPVGTLSTTSPLVRKKQLSLKKNKVKDKKKKKLKYKLKLGKMYRYEDYPASADGSQPEPSTEALVDPSPPLEAGYVYVGSLKVQILENLLRCPADGCFKNFRNDTLLKMHIKHYHRDLRKMLGATPKVLDLAYARTRPSVMEMRRLKLEAEHRTIKVKLPKLPKRLTEPKPEVKETLLEPKIEPSTSIKIEGEKIPRSLDSPKLRKALIHKPIRRPKVLLPVRRSEPSETVVSGTESIKEEDFDENRLVEPKVEVPEIEVLDFETAISTHTVTKPADSKHKGDKRRYASISKKTISEDEDWLGVNSDMETRSSYPRSGTPDSKLDQKLMSSESNEEQKEANYMFTETGERIKIVHMKREEIINCHCGFREEDGLMVQCELCLCWQHALCHNIQKESDVPEKYTCSICLNPRRGRRSRRFLHDQDRLYEGLLPGATPCESLRRSHELSGNLHRIEDALQALRVKYYVAIKKDHPKLYLWAKDWEAGELSMTQERLNSDYSDLSIMISSIGKENLPVKAEDLRDMQLDIRTPPSEEQPSDRFLSKDSQLGSQALLSGLLSSPGGASLDLPITTTELERLAKTVQEQEAQRVIIPQPEAAIENSACRERLLRHIQRCQALIDARLDSVEAQVAELESQDPSFEDDETADFFPRTKQTIQMMMRDLDTMEELGVIT